MSNLKTSVMKQIVVDIATLPEVNGKKYLIFAIDYFSKWSEMEAVENKTADQVSRFLFKLIRRHSCMSVQINGQGRDFVNRVSSHLHELTGTKQSVTSAYISQSNGIVESQNTIIKNTFLKTLRSESFIDKWPDILDGVKIFHRSVPHYSKKSKIKIGELVLMRRSDVKSGWAKKPHIIYKIDNNKCSLKNMHGKLLKNTYLISNLKHYVAKNLKQKGHKKQFKRKKLKCKLNIIR